MADMGSAAFAQMKDGGKVLNSGAKVDFVDCVTDKILEIADPGKANEWEIRVFDDESRNAFALPGRKIGVYTGMLEIADDQSQLAAVHGATRLRTCSRNTAMNESRQLMPQAPACRLPESHFPKMKPSAGRLLALLGLGAQVGILLPFSRAQESEADLLGLRLMVEAGFDPDGSVSLWQGNGERGRRRPRPNSCPRTPTHGRGSASFRTRSPMCSRCFRAALNSGQQARCGSPAR